MALGGMMIGDGQCARRQALTEIATAGGKACAITTDVADPASLENMISVVEQASGQTPSRCRRAVHPNSNHLAAV
jgi:hypothetical protein